MSKAPKFQWGFSPAKYEKYFDEANFFDLRFKAPSRTKSGNEVYREHLCSLTLAEALKLKQSLDIALDAYRNSEISYFPRKD